MSYSFPWTAACQASLSITNSWSLLKLMSIDLVMSSSHFILFPPLLLLPSNFPSIRIFSNQSVLRIMWPKYWSFSFNISPSNKYSGLISFRPDWLDFLTVQGTLKSLLQHHSSKVSILWCSAFFMVQRSHPHMTTGKTIVLTTWTFVGKVISLLFNMLFSLVIAFLPSRKHLLISWLQSPYAVILEPPKIKSLTASIVSPFICHEVMGPDAMILVFWMLNIKPAFSLSSFTFIKRLFCSSFLSGLERKESWAPKNWCFWTVLLKKTLESPLDSMKTKPVNPKGNQSWIFIVRTDVEAEIPYSGHLLQRTDSLEKTLMLGKIKHRRRRGRQRMRWSGGIANLIDMSLSKLQESLMVREDWRAAVHGVAQSQTWLKDWTDWLMF